jgi:transketolase
MSAATTPVASATKSERQRLARRVRERVLLLAGRGGCFVGASLSCADLLVHLYASVLRIRPETLADPERDYLFLSKGHDVPALYATLAELGFLERRRLRRHLKTSDSIYWHPSREIPGVEFHSGSLGHLLSVGIGVALDIQLSGGTNRVFVLLGDGELDEGSCWEAILVAAALRLGNLIAVVDRNHFQANAATEELLPLEPLAAKFEAFGWGCRSFDGHDFEALDAAFAGLPERPGMPTVLLAETVRGKGVPSLERRVERWFCSFSSAEVRALVRELRGGDATRLTSAARHLR